MAKSRGDRKSTRLNSSHDQISYAVFCLKKKKVAGGVEENLNDNTHNIREGAYVREHNIGHPSHIFVEQRAKHVRRCRLYLCFFFNDTATTEIYTLSLHDALPICATRVPSRPRSSMAFRRPPRPPERRSEEHTSELQSRSDLVCRLLLEKKKKKKNSHNIRKKKKKKKKQKKKQKKN